MTHSSQSQGVVSGHGDGSDSNAGDFIEHFSSVGQEVAIPKEGDVGRGLVALSAEKFEAEG